MNDPYLTKETLLLKLKNQYDEEAWQEFITTYEAYIHKILYTMNVKSSDINDIKQTIILNAWKHLPKFDYQKSKGKFRSWITAITRNAVKSFFRKSGRLHKVLNSEKRSNLDPYIQQSLSPEIEDISKREWKSFISEKALENVIPKLSKRLKLCFDDLIKGTPVPEIAAKLDVKENTIHAYKSRIQKRLCREVNRLENELG